MKKQAGSFVIHTCVISPSATGDGRRCACPGAGKQSRAYGQDSVFDSVAKTVKRDYACTGSIDYTSNSS